MAQEIPEIFKRVQDNKKESRELKKSYRDSLSVNAAYQQLLTELEALKIQKKKLETAVKDSFKEEFDRLDGLKLNIASDNQLISDLAIGKLSAGELIKLVDDNQVEYEPIFNVKFKKIS